MARSPEDYFWAAHAKSTCDFTPKTTKALLGKAFVALVVGPAGFEPGTPTPSRFFL